MEDIDAEIDEYITLWKENLLSTEGSTLLMDALIERRTDLLAALRELLDAILWDDLADDDSPFPLEIDGAVARRIRGMNLQERGFNEAAPDLLAEVERLFGENVRLREALFACAEGAGDDPFFNEGGEGYEALFGGKKLEAIE